MSRNDKAIGAVTKALIALGLMAPGSTPTDAAHRKAPSIDATPNQTLTSATAPCAAADNEPQCRLTRSSTSTADDDSATLRRSQSRAKRAEGGSSLLWPEHHTLSTR